MSTFEWKRPVKQTTWNLLVVFVGGGFVALFLGVYLGISGLKFLGAVVTVMGLSTSMANFIGSRYEWEVDSLLPAKLLMVAFFVGLIGGGVGLFMAWNARFVDQSGIILAGICIFVALIVMPSISAFLSGVIREMTPDEIVMEYEATMRMYTQDPLDRYQDDRVVGDLTRNGDDGYQGDYLASDLNLNGDDN